MDEDLKKALGSVRGKTWALLVMLFGATLYVQDHVKRDLEQEREIHGLLEYISHLEKRTSTYYYKIKTLEKEKYICTPP